MDATVNTLNWFEIPVSDINRAKKFYEEVFTIEMPQHDMMGMQMAFFPSENASGRVSGALVQSGMHRPSADGVIVYLNANPDLSGPLSKVKSAGGSIIMEKTNIAPDIGYMAFFTDSEGNTVAMHSNK
jgi:predicted enzyme related to lactoylglutathione lyase